MTNETERTIIARNASILMNFDAGKNFMTPRSLSTNYYPLREDSDVAGYIVEKSKGRGFRHEPIWGVSIMAIGVDGKRMFRGEDALSSQMHTTKNGADNHFRRVCRAFAANKFPTIAAKETT